MLIYKKISTLAVRHLLDPEVLGTIAGETAGPITGHLVKNVTEKLRSHLHRPQREAERGPGPVQ